jgi:DNA-binding NarL/FixJ family response regulator
MSHSSQPPLIEVSAADTSPVDGSVVRVAITGGTIGLRRRIERALFENGSSGHLEPATTTSAGEAAMAGHADVVVLARATSLSRPGVAVRRARAWSGDAPIIAVLEDGHGQAIRRLLDAGALGVVFESNLEEVLPITVQAVRAGQLTLPSQSRRQAQRPALSHRERQILRMAVLGSPNAEIASELYLAESTVKCHLSSAFSKLGVSSRSEAAALVLDPTEGVGTGILGLSFAAATEGSGGKR